MFPEAQPGPRHRAALRSSVRLAARWVHSSLGHPSNGQLYVPSDAKERANNQHHLPRPSLWSFVRGFVRTQKGNPASPTLSGKYCETFYSYMCKMKFYGQLEWMIWVLWRLEFKDVGSCYLFQHTCQCSSRSLTCCLNSFRPVTASASLSLTPINSSCSRATLVSSGSEVFLCYREKVHAGLKLIEW